MSTENLNNNDARKKLISIVQDIEVAMLVSNLGSKPLSAVPMNTKKVDDEGNIWFLSSLNSDHSQDIIKDADVQLLYSDNSNMVFISIYGEALINTEKTRLEKLYTKVDDTWFNGVDDPNLTAIQIIPKEAYYWDTKKNKFVSFFNIGLAATTKSKKDTGEKGKLDL